MHIRRWDPCWNQRRKEREEYWGVTCPLFPTPLASVSLHPLLFPFPLPSPPAPIPRTAVSAQAGSVQEGIIENKLRLRHTCQRVSHLKHYLYIPGLCTPKSTCLTAVSGRNLLHQIWNGKTVKRSAKDRPKSFIKLSDEVHLKHK